MAKTIRAALKKSLPSESKFWERMKKTLDESDGFGEWSAEQKEKILQFFLPEWEARDGRFFPRLDGFTAESLLAYPHSSELHNAYRWTTHSANKLATDLHWPFNKAMQMLLTLAACGAVERVPPFCTPKGLPAYNVKFNQAKTTVIMALHRADQPLSDLGFYASVFEWELVNGHYKFVYDTLVAACQVRSAPVEDVRATLANAPGRPWRAYDVATALGIERAVATNALLTLAKADPRFRRAKPYYRTEDSGISGGTPISFPLLQFECTVAPAQEAKAVIADDMRRLILEAVKEAVEQAMVHPDRVQMEAIRGMLRDRKLSTEDPAATIKAKLSKKRVPKPRT